MTKHAQNRNKPVVGNYRFQVTVEGTSQKDAKAQLDRFLGDAATKRSAGVKVKPGLPELWAVTEVAEALGLAAYQNVYQLVGLPKPVIQLNRGKLWLADDIREFAKKRKTK